MEKENLKNKINSVLPNVELKEGNQFLELIISPQELNKSSIILKNDFDLNFDYLVCISGVDYKEYFEMVYHLESTVNKHSIVLKCKILDRENPEIDSVMDIWKTAEFQERENFDLLGIKFKNHSDLRRIFLDDNWVGYPLRKDYEDENMTPLKN